MSIENEKFAYELNSTLSPKKIQIEEDTVDSKSNIYQYTYKVIVLLTFEDGSTKEIEQVGIISVIKDEKYKVNYYKLKARLSELKI